MYKIVAIFETMKVERRVSFDASVHHSDQLKKYKKLSKTIILELMNVERNYTEIMLGRSTVSLSVCLEKIDEIEVILKRNIPAVSEAFRKLYIKCCAVKAACLPEGDEKTQLNDLVRKNENLRPYFLYPREEFSFESSLKLLCLN